MKTKFYQIALLCIAFLGMANVVNAQTLTGSYDPFTTANVTALTQTEIVTDGSIHTYTYTGDVALASSTFVFKVVGGTIITSVDDVTPVGLETDGTYNVAEVTNQGSIVVLWDPEVVGVQKYVGVYELSSNGCISDNIIGGMKISVGAKPFVALALADDQICSNDEILIDVTITNGTSPWTMTLEDGSKNIKFIYYEGSEPTNAADFDYAVLVDASSGSFTKTFATPKTDYPYSETGASFDYTFSVLQFDDVVTLAELNDEGQVETGKGSVTAIVYPLPTIGTMAQVD